ncbi:hypothetical protein [Nitrosospira sp. NpAV]|uniref:hypothetical protein n=1 Tax=Nitrosospira sp. NpAV TaxID=58133 RepID=UPI0005A01EBE|nr:hypothetical protein [Nitrosospira sp. NpAV]KIO49173.1 hypothetical protein SQ11_07790 [Nitrosospira sp. NpAV]
MQILISFFWMKKRFDVSIGGKDQVFRFVWPLEKKRAPANGWRHELKQKGEDNHSVKVISSAFYREPITFHLLISFMDKEHVEINHREQEMKD